MTDGSRVFRNVTVQSQRMDPSKPGWWLSAPGGTVSVLADDPDVVAFYVLSDSYEEVS